MNNRRNYALVIETMPNSYQPITIYPKLEEIDAITSKYSSDEFKKFLLSVNLMENVTDNIVIIFHDNGIRKVKEGLIYRDDYSSDMPTYIKNFILAFKAQANILNELYQYINNKKTISDNTKNALKNIILNRKSLENILNSNFNSLDSLPYYDIRTIYLYIKNNLLVKLSLIKETDSLKRVPTFPSEN